jgi:hypothetical protein
MNILTVAHYVQCRGIWIGSRRKVFMQRLCHAVTPFPCQNELYECWEADNAATVLWKMCTRGPNGEVTVKFYGKMQ